MKSDFSRASRANGEFICGYLHLPQVRRWLGLCIIGCIWIISSGTAAETKSGVGKSLPEWLSMVEKMEGNAKVGEPLLDLPILGHSPAGDLGALASIFTHHPSEFVRQQTARVLGELDEEPQIAIPALAQGLADPDEGVRVQATAALIRRGQSAQAALWAAAQDFRTVDRNRAIGYMQKHTYATVSDYAVFALAHIPNIDPVPLLAAYHAAVKRGAWSEVDLPPTGEDQPEKSTFVPLQPALVITFPHNEVTLIGPFGRGDIAKSRRMARWDVAEE